MKLISALLMLFIATASLADPFPKGDAKTGQKLFERHKCNNCHTKIVGGDGNAIFTRADRKVHDVTELFAQMDACSGAGDPLTPHEKQHIGAYLNRYYNLE